MEHDEDIKRAPGGKWPKGVSGNPGGRPKTKVFKDAFLKLLAATSPDQFAAALAAKALAGDVAAFREMADRVDGKVAQTLENGEDGPLRLEVGWIQNALQSTTDRDDNSSPTTNGQNDLPASSPIDEPVKP